MKLMSPALKAQNLHFAYSARAILTDVGLEARGGELLGLAGPNGAGKTTLLKLLTGYLQPSAGTVQILGDDLQQLERREAARRIALVPQLASTSFPYRVHEMVLMGRHPYAGLGYVPTLEDKAIVREVLGQVGIAELADRPYHRLSGGEQRLVLLARALAQRAPILLLDEPLTALDLHHQWQVLRLLRDLQQAGTTIIATFHDLNIAAQWCTRVALLHQGSIVASGPPGDVLRQETLQRVYGLPLRVEAGEMVRIDLPSSSS